MDFLMDGLATGRAIRALAVVDSCLSSRRVTRVLEWIVG